MARLIDGRRLKCPQTSFWCVVYNFIVSERMVLACTHDKAPPTDFKLIRHTVRLQGSHLSIVVLLQSQTSKFGRVRYNSTSP